MGMGTGGHSGSSGTSEVGPPATGGTMSKTIDAPSSDVPMAQDGQGGAGEFDAAIVDAPGFGDVPGSGDDSSGDAPSGDGPSGDGPSGDAPSGDGPSGDGPVGSLGETAADATASSSECGAAASTLSQTFSFAKGLGTLSPNPPTLAGAHLAFVTAGPAANPTLCTATTGCAALSMAFVSGTPAWDDILTVSEDLSPSANLTGSTITFDIAVDNPGPTPVPIQLQAFAAGDPSTGYSWSAPITLGNSELTSYMPTTGFKDLSLALADYSGTTVYCASATASIGLQLQNVAAVTSSNAGTVTVYISKITVTPPP